ncbi:MAG: alpha/beta hydrolase [Actinomycetota bacterium]
MSPPSWAVRVVLLLAVAGLLYAGLVLLEDRFIYFPSRAITATPADVSLEFEDVYFEPPDGVRLHGWWVPGDAHDVTLLWLHGNAGNLGDRVGILELLHDELGASIFMFDYRGYGRSEGKPSEQGLYADARAALEALRSHGGAESHDVVLYGQSLGAAVAVELASARPTRAVVLEAPFTSVPDMARHHYGFLPVASLLRSSFDTEARISDIDAPLLVMHGDRDDIVPLNMGERVFAAAREPKEFNVLEGAGHNDAHLADDYAAALRSFLDGLEAPD